MSGLGPSPLLALLAAGLGAAWVGLVRSDRRALAADPRRHLLDDELEGRPLEIPGADGTVLRGQEFGPECAPALVLAHGWTCSHRFWAEQIRSLRSDHRVIAYDLRGHGRSDRPAHGDYTIEAHAADMATVLQGTLAAGERAVVAGHSMGAMTLVALAANEPAAICERVAAAALINTGMGDLFTEGFILDRASRRSPRLAALIRRAAAAPVELPTRPTPISHRVIRHLVLDSSASPAEVAFCERIILECPAQVRGGCGGTLTTLDLYEAIASLDVPTAVIAGERDRLIPAHHARRLAEALPNLDGPVITRGTGHMMPVTDPELVTGRIRALVADHLAVPAHA
jgi:pimeloyl-ACP methyl ester carboxylesterase